MKEICMISKYAKEGIQSIKDRKRRSLSHELIDRVAMEDKDLRETVIITRDAADSFIKQNPDTSQCKDAGVIKDIANLALADANATKGNEVFTKYGTHQAALEVIRAIGDNIEPSDISKAAQNLIKGTSIGECDGRYDYTEKRAAPLFKAGAKYINVLAEAAGDQKATGIIASGGITPGLGVLNVLASLHEIKADCSPKPPCPVCENKPKAEKEIKLETGNIRSPIKTNDAVGKFAGGLLKTGFHTLVGKMKGNVMGGVAGVAIGVTAGVLLLSNPIGIAIAGIGGLVVGGAVGGKIGKVIGLRKGLKKGFM